jgi:hypothetical protein
VSVTPDQIAKGIIATLDASCGLSCELGTPERKIIDAVAQAVSTAYVSNYLTGSLLDVETKTGLELDQFVGVFGFGRLQGKAARGVVTVSVTTPLNQNYEIKKGTQFFTKNSMNVNSAPLYFSSTQEVVLTAQTYSVDIAVQCTSVGVAGNVAPDTVTSMGSMVGSSTCSNLLSMTGGRDVETDEELRHRFANTFLRNVAGTADWYKALCLQNNSVSRAEVYGPVSTYRTQVAGPGSSNSDGSVALPVFRSTTQSGGGGTDVSYVWSGMESVFTNLGMANETHYSRLFDYELSSGATVPQFLRKASGAINAGDIVDVEFEYTSSASRNDPVNGITNKVDVYIDGSSPFTVTESTTVSSSLLNITPDSPYNINNFERVNSSGVPVSGNRFTRLNCCPIIKFPASITIGTAVYTMGIHYWWIRDKTKKRGSPYEVSGIEWTNTSVNGQNGPDTGAEVIVSYVYNQTPETVTASISAAKQICTDVMVHQADYRYIRPCLTVRYSHGYDVSTVDTAINSRLTLFFQSLGFGSWVEVSKMCLAAQQVLGVSSVKLTTSGNDGSYYGIRVYRNSGDTVFIQENNDFKLSDNQVAQFLTARIRREATP